MLFRVNKNDSNTTLCYLKKMKTTVRPHWRLTLFFDFLETFFNEMKLKSAELFPVNTWVLHTVSHLVATPIEKVLIPPSPPTEPAKTPSTINKNQQRTIALKTTCYQKVHCVRKGSKTSTTNFWESQHSDGLSVSCGIQSLNVKRMQSSATSEMLLIERSMFAVQFVQAAYAKWSFHQNEKDQSYGISKHGNLSRTGENH